MAFHVDVQPQAFDDLDLIAEYIKKRSSFATAEKWFNGIMDQIATLEEMPERCPIAPESEDIGQPVRALLYGRKNRTYKVFFGVTHRQGMVLFPFITSAITELYNPKTAQSLKKH